MRRLEDAREHLDGDLEDTRRLDGNLRDLARVNRSFGGADLSITAVRRLVEVAPTGLGPRPLRVLDVGTGAADIPLALLHAGGPWPAVRVTVTDSRPEVLEAALRLRPELAEAAGVEVAVADGRSLPFPDNSFDVAHASLVLHHLSRADAVAFLGELDRVARIGIVVNDLSRSRLGWLGAWLVLHATTRNPWTLRDGPLSVRRAWTLREARALLAEAGLRPLSTVVGVARHRWAIAAVSR